MPSPDLGLVFRGEPNARGEHDPINADVPLRHVLRRALRRAGLPLLRFHDLRYVAGTLMHEAGVPLERARQILAHGSEHDARALNPLMSPRSRTRPTKSRTWRGSLTWETNGKQLAP